MIVWLAGGSTMVPVAAKDAEVVCIFIVSTDVANSLAVVGDGDNLIKCNAVDSLGGMNVNPDNLLFFL